MRDSAIDISTPVRERLGALAYENIVLSARLTQAYEKIAELEAHLEKRGEVTTLASTMETMD